MDRQTDGPALPSSGSVADGVDADRSLVVMGLKFHLCSLSIWRQLCVLELWVVVIKEVKFKTRKKR